MVERLVLEPVLDLQATGRLAAQLAATQGPVALDASQVNHVGGIAAQLLLSARLSNGYAGAGLVVEDPSPDFTSGMRRLGFDPALFGG